MNLDLDPEEFKNYILEGINKKENKFFVQIAEEIESKKFDLVKFKFTDDEVLKLISTKSKSLLPYFIIVYICGRTNLPHVQWMYAHYMKSNFNELKEIDEIILQVKNKMEKFFPFLTNKDELPKYLIEKLIGKKNNNNLISIKNADIAFNKTISKKRYKEAIEVALHSYIKFKDTYLLFKAIVIIYDLKLTNEALKALVLLTYEKPLEPNTILMWGNISVNMVSNRNYWIPRLGYMLYPENSGILANLAASLTGVGSYKESKEILEKAIRISKESSSYLLNYANLKLSEGQADDAVEILKKIEKESKTYNDKITSNLLFISQYSTNINYKELKERHINASERRRKENTSIKTSCVKKLNELNDKIKIGFVSFDLINHPVSYFLYPLIKNLSKEKFEIYIFYTRQRRDHVTKLFINIVNDNFIDISSMDLKKQINTIQEKEIDLLIDLAGHTAGNNLDIFLLKPALNQATYLGYPFTTGLKEIEYRFHDCCYPDDREFYTEKRIDVEGSVVCYQPLIGRLDLLNSETYEVKESPVIKNNYVTFGLSTNPGKINDKVVRVYAEILKRVKNSKLLIEAAGFSDKEYAEMFYNRFKRYDIDRENLILLPRDSSKQYLIYNQIDIALDPFPYNGGTSTMDLLYMGLPMITLKGNVGMSASGAATLMQLGKINQIANTEEEYIEIACTLSEDSKKLEEQRSNQRVLLAESPLMNQKNFGINFGNAILKIVKQSS